MPYSFETGEHAPNIPNQPKLPMKHFAALTASILVSFGNHNTETAKELISNGVGSTVELIGKNLSYLALSHRK